MNPNQRPVAADLRTLFPVLGLVVGLIAMALVPGVGLKGPFLGALIGLVLGLILQWQISRWAADLRSRLEKHMAPMLAWYAAVRKTIDRLPADRARQLTLDLLPAFLEPTDRPNAPLPPNAHPTLREFAETFAGLAFDASGAMILPAPDDSPSPPPGLIILAGGGEAATFSRADLASGKVDEVHAPNASAPLSQDPFPSVWHWCLFILLDTYEHPDADALMPQGARLADRPA